MTIVQEIRECIEKQLDKSKTDFVIFPFGGIGLQVNEILRQSYNITPKYILDNHLCKYNPNIKPLQVLKSINCDNLIVILSSINPKIYTNLKNSVMEYIKEENITELNSMLPTAIRDITTVGKYSYGPLCNHWLVESVGAFCSFAVGSDVVQNHATQYLSTHPFMYYGREHNTVHSKSYKDYDSLPWFFEGISPLGTADKLRRIKIGNDVWIGKNVIITNGSNIGNGVIAGAGSIITKDVPDYAIVAGAPARIIRYRYTQNQIKLLNKIQWWNWSDNKIRENYNDFFLSIDKFIEKYLVE